MHLHFESSEATGKISLTSPAMEISSDVRVMDKNRPESGEQSAFKKGAGMAVVAWSCVTKQGRSSTWRYNEG